MIKEKLQEYALIAEIIGGMAIVASLFFVGMQVRQSAAETALNTRQMQSDAFAQLMTNIAEINALSLEYPELIEITDKADSGEPITRM